MKQIKTIVFAVAAALLFSVPAVAQEASSLSELLRQIERGETADTAEARRREAEFRSRQSEQQQLLNQAIAERDAARALGERLSSQYDENEAALAIAQEELKKELGNLTELFGEIQQVTGDLQGVFSASPTNLQFAEREDFLVALGAKMGSSSELAEIEEIEQLWFEMQREIVESGKVAKFTTEIVTGDNEITTAEVVRVGNFNVVAPGRFLEYKVLEGASVLKGLPKQPAGRFTSAASDVANAAPGTTVIAGVDPTGGSVLATLVASKSVRDRINDGGVVGYCIIALGAVGLLIAVFLFVSLTTASAKVSSQLKDVGNPRDDNALGRVLKAYTSNKSVDTETLELKLNEAVLKEVPKIQRGILLVKVISVVAPLAGLLGTVTGMIKTFQVITLYGAGDPKLMAGGISQALMTTVLGLVVAIPMVLLHTVLSGRAKSLLGILQEQSAGLIAEHSEAAHSAQ